jgi:Na+/H+ antiporter NhaD/arsenite permease-like protein
MTHEHLPSGTSSKAVLSGIAILVLLYIVACTFGWPQYGTALIQGQGGGDAGFPTAGEHGPRPPSTEASREQHAHTIHPPGYFWLAPFALLLLGIAVLPLLSKTTHWWESNLHRFYLAAGLGLLTLLYYLVGFDGPLHVHWPAEAIVKPIPGEALQWGLLWTVFANAILHEFIPFIVLLLSLYTISGGIRIEGNLAAHPLVNTAFIGVGGLLASFIGTTGAAMLLIRPLLETNRERQYSVHTVVFFIFVVCNCGGCLLPIGDPPLFLGYLRGVDFLWTMSLWKPWLAVNLALLAIYWAWDQFVSYPREAQQSIARDESQKRHLKIRGWILNGPLLLGVVLSVALLDPSKLLLGTDWYAPLYLREIVQIGLVGISLLLGSRTIRRDNAFNYDAILEVAALFFGIFICMQPALQILNAEGGKLGIETASQFFWITGGLSSVLDNAPTYVVFFETARTLNPTAAPLPVTVIRPEFLVAISLGAVFLGAMTYIGNGPNFMVKAIAETSGVRMPSFFGYLKYSCLILLPVLILASLVFL